MVDWYQFEFFSMASQSPSLIETKGESATINYTFNNYS